MKKPVLISSLIHIVIFGGLAIAVISHPRPASFTEGHLESTQVELNSWSSTAHQASVSASASNLTGQEITKKGEGVVGNSTFSSTPSQVSGPANPLNEYFSELQKKIQSEERYPKEARKRGIEEVIVVQFALNDQGEITQISLFSRPHSEVLGEAALEAVKSAAPFSAPPAGISKEFRIPIEFKIK